MTGELIRIARQWQEEHGGTLEEAMSMVQFVADKLPDQNVVENLTRAGIDYARLKACLDGRDNWGKMVHAFEYQTVCEVVLGVLREARHDPL